MAVAAGLGLAQSLFCQTGEEAAAAPLTEEQAHFVQAFQDACWRDLDEGPWRVRFARSVEHALPSGPRRELCLAHLREDAAARSDDPEAIAQDAQSVSALLPLEDSYSASTVILEVDGEASRSITLDGSGELLEWWLVDRSKGMRIIWRPGAVEWNQSSLPGLVDIQLLGPTAPSRLPVGVVSLPPFCRWAVLHGGAVTQWENGRHLRVRWSSQPHRTEPYRFLLPHTWTIGGGSIEVDVLRLGPSDSGLFEATVTYRCPHGQLLARKQYGEVGSRRVMRDIWLIYVPGEEHPLLEYVREERVLAAAPMRSIEPPAAVGWLVQDSRLVKERGVLHYVMPDTGLPDLETLRTMPVLDER